MAGHSYATAAPEPISRYFSVWQHAILVYGGVGSTQYHAMLVGGYLEHDISRYVNSEGLCATLYHAMLSVSVSLASYLSLGLNRAILHSGSVRLRYVISKQCNFELGVSVIPQRFAIKGEENKVEQRP